MQYFIEKFGLFYGWFITAGIQIIRYIIFSGTLFFIFYILRKNSWFHRKIQQKFPKKQNIYTEIGYSITTLMIFSFFILGIYFARINGLTQIYLEISEYGWFYLLFSIVFLLVFHDTYFYWTHRMMHHPKLYPIVHRVHHLSHNPSPWAAFSFHPLEAVVEFSVILIIFIVPLHPLALFIFATISISMNVIGHLGYEIFPKNFTKHPFWKWQNTSTHHNMHHQLVKCNYGLYFNFWDQLMGTNHADYHTRFDEVKSREKT